MIVGEMKDLGKDETPRFEGSIDTLALSVTFRVCRNIHKRGSKEPDFSILTTLPNGRAVQIGAVWERKTVRGANPGSVFYSLVFDDPSLPQEIGVAAFRREGTNIWDLTFRRRQPKAAA